MSAKSKYFANTTQPFSATLILIISACEGLKKNDLDVSIFDYIQSGIQILRVREEREVLNGRAVDMIMQILKTANLPMDLSFMQAQENIVGVVFPFF